MRIFKQNLYAIQLPENKGYLYFTFLGGTQDIGYTFEVYNYISHEIEYDNINYIIQQESLFPNKYITAYIQPSDKGILYKVGKVNLDYQNKTYTINEKHSAECTHGKLLNLLGLDFDEDVPFAKFVENIKNTAKSGGIIKCNAWEIYTYTTNKKGSFELINEQKIGNLKKKYRYSMIFGTAYLISDIVDYYITGMDRITAQILIYQ